MKTQTGNPDILTSEEIEKHISKNFLPGTQLSDEEKTRAHKIE